MMKKRLITTVSALISACTLLSAQNEDVTVKGSIVSADDGSPVDYATIILSPSNMYSMSDQDGLFNIDRVPAGEISLSVEFFGMESIDTVFTAKSGQTIELALSMKPVSFRLEHVVVTATQN